MKQAACIILPQTIGSFLAVSRRNSPDMWGLPGGKVDPGESISQAAVRELKEETGIIIPENQIFPVYCDVCFGQGQDDTYWVTAFSVYCYHDKDGRFTHPFMDDIQVLHEDREQDLNLAFKTKGTLIHKNSSPFWSYNQAALSCFYNSIQ